MSIVTLYKNCILNANYDEVFDTKVYGLFEAYLDTLTKYQVVTDNNEIYMTDTGALPLSINIVDGETVSLIYEYNYMKIEMVAGKPWYCFIDSIDILNGVAVVNYTLDVWHTFYEYTQFRRGFIENSNWYKENEPLQLPIEPFSNNGLILQNLKSTSGSVWLYLELQAYELETTEQKQRHTLSLAVKLNNAKVNALYKTAFDENAFITIDALETVINDITNRQAENNILNVRQRVLSTTFVFKYKYYDVIDIHIFPDGFLDDVVEVKENEEEYFARFETSYIKNTSYELGHETMYLTRIDETNSTIRHLINSTVIPFNIKNRFFGSSFIDVPLNGLATTASYYIELCENNVKIKLGINGVEQDITNDYKIDVPFTSITGETAMQRKISIQMERTRAFTQLLDIGTIPPNIEAAKNLTKSPRLPKTKLKKAMQVRDITGSITASASSAVMGLATAIKSLTPQYQSTYKSTPASSALLACLYTYVLWRIDVINEEQIKKDVKEGGYNLSLLVTEMPNETNFETTNTFNEYVGDFNYIKFGVVNLSGIQSDYLDDIISILSNGVKIWKTSEV